MEPAIEKECSALGGLFQLIIQEMKTSGPVWEDFLSKSSKLHHTLRATIFATSAFLEAFQRLADMATNTRGAREIGSALTRLCMRHKAIEQKLKAFNSSILDLLVNPMQDRMEEWKKNVVQLDKEHAKEYKKARAEIRKAASDSVRLQKKVKKGKDKQTMLENAVQDVSDKYNNLEETEKRAVRTALVEERSRFCLFVSCLKPVVDNELSMLMEVTHLQEILQQLCLQAGDPHILPPSSEQLILDAKGDSGQWNFHLNKSSPPGSPSSLGSRKSSMCSISSMTSSSSGSTGTSHSPSHHLRSKSLVVPPSGVTRLSSVSSQDSGFTSQDTLFLKPNTPPPKSIPENPAETSSNGSNSSAENSASASTWTNWPELPLKDGGGAALERPHTISSTYEKAHSRPALTSKTFEALPSHGHPTAPSTPNPYAVPCIVPQNGGCPPLRDPRVIHEPTVTRSPSVGPKPRGKPVFPPKVPDFNAPVIDQHIPQPVYVNMNDLANMASEKHDEGGQPIYSQPVQVKLESVQSGNGEVKVRSQTGPRIYAVGLMANSEQALPGDGPACKDEHGHQSSVGPNGPNSSELVNAIKDLESNAVLLGAAFDSTDAAAACHTSAQLSSLHDEEGIIMPPPPASWLSVASQLPMSSSVMPTREACSLLRCHSERSKPPIAPKRPVSTAGVRRGSFIKPAPPVRRSSSIVGTMPNSLPLLRSPNVVSSYATGDTTPTPEYTSTSPRKSSSEGSAKLVRKGSILASHGHMIQTLNAKFGEKMHTNGTNSPQAYGPGKISAPSASNESLDDVTPTGDAPSPGSLLFQIQNGVKLRKATTNDRSVPRM